MSYILGKKIKQYTKLLKNYLIFLSLMKFY